jgi:predicted GNAT family N-acyltransferase
MNSETRPPGNPETGRPYRVFRARWPQEEEAIRSIRHQVFVLEQKVPPEMEWDSRDAICRHVLVEDGTHRLIATGRLDPHGKIGRMAVLQAARRSGVGSLVLTALIEWARELSFASCYLHAQIHALPFYHRHGFEEEGFLFYEAGIPHLKMSRPTATPISQVVEDSAGLDRAICRLAAMTRQRLRLELPDILPISQSWTALQKTVLRLSRNPIPLPVRVLVLPEVLEKAEMAGWKNLTRRLPSHVAVRCPATEEPGHPWRLVIGDTRHLIRIPRDPEAKGYLRLEDPHQALPEANRFDERWEHSTPPVGLNGWTG